MVRSKDRHERCLQNCLAWFRDHGLEPPAPLATHADRVYFARDIPDERFEDLERAGVLEPWDAVRNHGADALRGWREAVARASCQIVLFPRLIEVDFDYWNPGAGLAPAVLHWFEVVRNAAANRKTDPFKIAKQRGWIL